MSVLHVAKRRRLSKMDVDEDWGDDDVCFSQEVSKFDEICSQSQGPNGQPPIATSTPRRWDSGCYDQSQSGVGGGVGDGFRQPAPPRSSATSSSNGVGSRPRNGDGRRGAAPSQQRQQQQQLQQQLQQQPREGTPEMELEKLRKELKAAQSEKLRHAGEVANLRAAQENHQREMADVKSELDKRREEQVRRETEKTNDALKNLEKIKKERDHLETQLAFKSREVADANQQKEDLARLVDERRKADESTSTSRGPSPKRVKPSGAKRDAPPFGGGRGGGGGGGVVPPPLPPPTMTLDQSGFPLSQIEFSAMPSATPNGFIKTGSGKKGVSTKEAEAQTRDSMEGREAKERRRRSRVKRSDGASTGYSGARCVDHLLTTIQSQEGFLTELLTDASVVKGCFSSSSSTSSSSSFDRRSTWRELLEGLRELLRTKNLKESAESEAFVYVGLPLISFVERIVASCVANLDGRRKNGEIRNSEASVFDVVFDLTSTSMSQLTILLRYSPKIFRDDILTKLASDRNKPDDKKPPPPNGVDFPRRPPPNGVDSPRRPPLINNLAAIFQHFAAASSSSSSSSSHSPPSSSFLRLLVRAFDALRALASSCGDASSIAALFTPLLGAGPESPAPIHAVLSAVVDLRFRSSSSSSSSSKSTLTSSSASSSSASSSSSSTSETESLISEVVVSCGGCVSRVVASKEAYSMTCGESEECFWLLVFRALVRCTVGAAFAIDRENHAVDGNRENEYENGVATVNVDASGDDAAAANAIQRVSPSVASAAALLFAAAGSLFDAAFAIVAPFPRSGGATSAASASTILNTMESTSSMTAPSAAPTPAAPSAAAISGAASSSASRRLSRLDSSSFASCACLGVLVDSVLQAVVNVTRAVDALRYRRPPPFSESRSSLTTGLRVALKGCRSLIHLRRGHPSFASGPTDHFSVNANNNNNGVNNNNNNNNNDKSLRFVVAHLIPILQENVSELKISKQEISELDASLRPAASVAASAASTNTSASVPVKKEVSIPMDLS